MARSVQASITPYFVRRESTVLVSNNNLKLGARNDSQWLSLCCISKFRCASRGHACCVQTCTSVLLFLASDVAVDGLITVWKVQIWGRNIVSEIMAFNQDLKISVGISLATTH